MRRLLSPRCCGQSCSPVGIYSRVVFADRALVAGRLVVRGIGEVPPRHRIAGHRDSTLPIGICIRRRLARAADYGIAVGTGHGDVGRHRREVPVGRLHTGRALARPAFKPGVIGTQQQVKDVSLIGVARRAEIDERIQEAGIDQVGVAVKDRALQEGLREVGSCPAFYLELRAGETRAGQDRRTELRPVDRRRGAGEVDAEQIGAGEVGSSQVRAGGRRAGTGEAGRRAALVAVCGLARERRRCVAK